MQRWVHFMQKMVQTLNQQMKCLVEIYMSTIVKLHRAEFEKCAKTKNSIQKLMMKINICFLKISSEQNC